MALSEAAVPFMTSTYSGSMRFGGEYVFSEGSASDGRRRRNADLRIKTPPERETRRAERGGSHDARTTNQHRRPSTVHPSVIITTRPDGTARHADNRQPLTCTVQLYIINGFLQSVLAASTRAPLSRARSATGDGAVWNPPMALVRAAAHPSAERMLPLSGGMRSPTLHHAREPQRRHACPLMLSTDHCRGAMGALCQDAASLSA